MQAWHLDARLVDRGKCWIEANHPASVNHSYPASVRLVDRGIRCCIEAHHLAVGADQRHHDARAIDVFSRDNLDLDLLDTPVGGLCRGARHLLASRSGGGLGHWGGGVVGGIGAAVAEVPASGGRRRVRCWRVPRRLRVVVTRRRVASVGVGVGGWCGRRCRLLRLCSSLCRRSSKSWSENHVQQMEQARARHKERCNNLLVGRRTLVGHAWRCWRARLI